MHVNIFGASSALPETPLGNGTDRSGSLVISPGKVGPPNVLSGPWLSLSASIVTARERDAEAVKYGGMKDA